MDVVRIVDKRMIFTTAMIAPRRPTFYLTISPPGKNDSAVVDEIQFSKYAGIEVSLDSQIKIFVIPGYKHQI